MSSFNILSTKFFRPRSSGFFLFSFLFLVALSPILFLFPQNVYAVDVTLAWDPNSEKDLDGYRVFCREDGESYNYNVPTWEGNDTSCTIPVLDDTTKYYFVARAFDESGNESGDSNEVAYEPQDNEEPEANAVDQTVYEGQTVTLDSSGSHDPDGYIVSYSWTKIKGPAVTLSDPLVARPTFTAPAPGVGPGESSLTFRLTVTDNGDLQSTDTCDIDILPESNLAPLDAVITSPDYYQIECDLLLLITTEPFSDPDGDSHSQSRWQISKQDNFSSLILDVTSTKHLTKLPVPHTVLEPDTSYYVRVQFYDVYLEPSDWSDVVSDAIKFTTASYNNDVDPDGVPGVPDDQEVDADVDLNKDGIADNDQFGDIKCIQSVLGDVTIGVCKASDSITAIEALETIDPATISDNTNRPSNLSFGLFSYRLSVNEPGATATVRIYFSKDISTAGTFYKYDTINGWQDYSEYATINNDGRSVTLELKDGGYGDSDGRANGFIVDPGGLAEASSTDVETSSTSGGDVGSHDSGCFIATAAFGSYAEPHVRLLRDFRDQCLLTNMPGTWFVRMYYRYGPFWADFINIHTWSKPIIRLALMPLIGISYVLIKASVATNILAGLMLALFALGWFLRMPGRPVTGSEQA